jgi:hypothetical protein
MPDLLLAVNIFFFSATPIKSFLFWGTDGGDSGTFEAVE